MARFKMGKEWLNEQYAEYEDLRVDIDNGITLCKKCHYEVHSKMKR